MIEVEGDVDGANAVLEPYWLAPKNRGERGQALLPIEQQLVASESTGVLLYCEVA